MILVGHISVSYILARTAMSLGLPLEDREILWIVGVGVLPDLDLLLSFLQKNAGDVHHRFPTHTPAGLFLVWILFTILLPHHQLHFYLLLLATLFIHLILDDVGFWLCRLGLQKISQYRQIQWLYPLERFPQDHYKATRSKIMRTYIRDARMSVVVEVSVSIIALILFLYVK